MSGLASVLEREWGLTDVRIAVHNGGMNSQTWWVDQGVRRWVAKAVPAGQREGFAAGLRVASRLAAAGVPSGAPVPTASGDLTADLDGRPVALLEFVPGEELSAGRADDRRLMGATLGRVHTVLTGVTGVAAMPMHWVQATAGHLDLRDWIRPAVGAVLADVRRLDPTSLTTGLLHNDPAPEAFRHDPASRQVGLIDWATAMVGPFMYDLASAVMYVGGPGPATGLIEAYLASGPLGRGEVERALPTMLRYRWAVQAWYFAHRITHDDLTGIADRAENEKGLADARAALGA